MKYFIIIAAFVVGAMSTLKTFVNHQLWCVNPQNQPQLDDLHKLSKNTDGYFFWSDISTSDQSVDIMVSPEKRVEFLELMNNTKMKYKLCMNDVQQYVDGSNTMALKFGKFDWTSYGSLNDINTWLRGLTKQYPNNVELVVGGSTFEGRQILGVKVSFNSSNAKRGVFIEGGIHAREWIAPAVVTYMLNELLTSQDSEVRAIAENFDWYVFPVTNPDGYVYTEETNRLWRKTRQPYGICYGADPNRNWDHNWNIIINRDTHPCEETFAGSAPLSEIETRTLSEYISTIANNLVAYISYHSYSQMLLIPYGNGTKPSNFDELQEVGDISVKELQEVHGTKFKVGNVAETIYPVTGSSMDWVKSKHNIRFVYTYELRDTGLYKFLLPPKFIKPSGEEMMKALIVMMQELIKRA